MGSGDDTFFARALIGPLNGNDVVDGGVGVDTYDASAATNGLTIKNNSASQTDVLGGGPTFAAKTAQDDGTEISTDTVTFVENVNGAGAHERIVGSVVANRLDGAVGDDDLYGLAGNDALIGGDGADDLVGDLGRDMLSAFESPYLAEPHGHYARRDRA